jgi:hypothetical protein
MITAHGSQLRGFAAAEGLTAAQRNARGPAGAVGGTLATIGGVNPIYEQFLQTAGSAVTLLGDPAVAAAWDQPSVLDGFGVSGLAGHLARQIFLVPRLLAQPTPDGAALTLLEHYAAVPWVTADPASRGQEADPVITQGDAEAAIGPRALATSAAAATADPVIMQGEAEAAIGPAALASSAAATAKALATALPAEQPDRLVHLPWGPWSLSLGDFLVTRMMEIAVHSDDLALSAGVPTPELPEQASSIVLLLLVSLAARRHGNTAVLRALSRAERAPATIAAF